MNVIAAVVAAIGGWQFVKYILNLGSNRRITAAEAVKVEYDNIITEYKRMQRKVDDLEKQMTEMRKEVDSLKNERLDLIKENGELRLKLKEAEHNVCMRPDGDCVRRLPPRAYCALYQVAEGRLISEDARKDKEEHKNEDNGIYEKPDKG